MKYDLQIQTDYIREPVRARFAMVSPILLGMLYSTKGKMVLQAGGYERITFEMFCRIYVEHPGDYGICFEYSLHDSIEKRNNLIYPKISYVLDNYCGIKGQAESILFGLEKNGPHKILETAKNTLTNQSKILTGTQARPTFLKRHLNNVALAFRNRNHALMLPQSIRGIWKADLFLGSPESDYWVATTLKTNRAHIEGAPGLRIAIYPEERQNEAPRVNGSLIHCPLPYRGEFMELFGASFQIVKQLVASKGKEPSPVALVYDHDREVAKWLSARVHFPILDIIEALEPIKQPGLIQTDTSPLDLGDNDVTVSAPIPIVE